MTWDDMGWKEPVIEERFDPDRTSLILEFVKKQANKKQANKKQANKKQANKKQANKTIENIEKIKKYLSLNGESKVSDIAKEIDLSPARTRAIISKMEEVGANGKTNSRTYYLK